ncbi:hypothetical protein PPYR_00596 [Photinus pyralis]|uniref:Uncharacterized protein n=1 Tax=Photinus pyralis TaxID=7054 RepID=A0A1Y1LKW8_PHOPY|nr:uncharacterized protein LOC116182511 [Photinus pyralis]KAB0803626.1 hypothetical protein PPYR_00596 [Photinus pyralis]
MIKKLVLCVFIAWITQGTSFDVAKVLLEKQLQDQTCVKELNFDSTHLSNIFDENFIVRRPIHPNTIEFYECNIRKFHLIKADGQLNREPLIDKLVRLGPLLLKDKIDDCAAHDLWQTLYNSCSAAKGTSPLEKIIDFHDCVIIELAKLSITE